MHQPFAIRLKVGKSKTKVIPACTHCGRPAAKEALFKQSGAIVVEKYCDECIMDPVKFRALLKEQYRAQRIIL